LKIIHQNFPLVSVVLITARPELNTALQAMREGATDYLLKPLKPQQIIDRTETFLARQANERRKREIESQIKDLQAELLRLESAEADTVETEQKAIHTGERFLIRGSLKLDLHARRLLLGKNTINLPRTTFDYLVVLARHAPKVVDFQTLVAEAQGYQTDAREAQELVKWHIHHIRKAIEPNVSKPRYLTNVRGIGYQLVME
jgi:DNA-binding response OmpR family regulator